jgi:hypothetical protein
VKNNGTLYAHVVFARSGVKIDAPADEIPADAMLTKSHSKQLAAWMCSGHLTSSAAVVVE